MENTFETFKLKKTYGRKYVDYCYLDIKPHNSLHEFQCFPHFNNTISLYRSHTPLSSGEMAFDAAAEPFQIFTPIREKVLTVKQSGPVYRIVIVFHPLGIQQFYKDLNFADCSNGFEFFTPKELQMLFSTQDTEMLTDFLDTFLEKRYTACNYPVLKAAVSYIFSHYETFSVAALSNTTGTSRQHLNRIFRMHLGVSVKKFHEIVVFRQTMHKKLFENPGVNFTALAHEFNYSDQSHFNKTYKNLTKNTPKAFYDKGTVLGQEDTFWHLHS